MRGLLGRRRRCCGTRDAGGYFLGSSSTAFSFVLGFVVIVDDLRDLDILGPGMLPSSLLVLRVVDLLDLVILALRLFAFSFPLILPWRAVDGLLCDFPRTKAVLGADALGVLLSRELLLRLGL